uniref:Uncharacterized protein n=1 Tax=Rhizophora mucronata TaxID=61149 RepID=A0A2P2IYC4_RHIMU
MLNDHINYNSHQLGRELNPRHKEQSEVKIH